MKPENKFDKDHVLDTRQHRIVTISSFTAKGDFATISIAHTHDAPLHRSTPFPCRLAPAVNQRFAPGSY